MRCALLLAAVLASHDGQRVPPRPQTDMEARIARVEQWLKAVNRHKPGTPDGPAMEVAGWSNATLRTLWIDTNVVVKLIRNPKALHFSIQNEGQRQPEEIRYAVSDLRRLRVLACAAGGQVGGGMTPAESHCLQIGASNELDGDLRDLARRARDLRQSGDDNFILRRGAILEADVAMLVPKGSEPVPTVAGPGPDRLRMNLTDGQGTAFRQVGVHWDVARMLLDFVTPAGADRPAPGRDDMVRDWYRATAAWMQDRQDYDTDHLDRAREVFPADPVILFLSGSQAEIYAAPHVQSGVRSAVLPPNARLSIGSDRAELHQAEGYYRRASAADPSLPQLRLHLGHVLLLLEREADAAMELRAALDVEDDPLPRYYGQLFLGAAEEHLGRLDDARSSYGEAAALYPNAQSPHLAMSALARRRGDRATALREMQTVFGLQHGESLPDDPWWTYYKSHARNADDLLEALWRPFLAEVQP